uniref:Uncharacterized protein n=1 Tax=Anguilla anguilla TaxID=7936 RepID=A0A0E9WZS8_ANGAN
MMLPGFTEKTYKNRKKLNLNGNLVRAIQAQSPSNLPRGFTERSCMAVSGIRPAFWTAPLVPSACGPSVEPRLYTVFSMTKHSTSHLTVSMKRTVTEHYFILWNI